MPKYTTENERIKKKKSVELSLCPSHVRECCTKYQPGQSGSLGSEAMEPCIPLGAPLAQKARKGVR